MHIFATLPLSSASYLNRKNVLKYRVDLGQRLSLHMLFRKYVSDIAKFPEVSSEFLDIRWRDLKVELRAIYIYPI